MSRERGVIGRQGDAQLYTTFTRIQPEQGDGLRDSTRCMTPDDLEMAADHVAERTRLATGLRAPFEIVDVDGELQLRLYDEPVVTITRGIQAPEDLDRSHYTAEDVGNWFSDELLDVRAWTAADLVSVREQALERQLDRVESRVGRRLATLLRRRFVDPRTCFHGPHGGVVGSLTFDIASAPPASSDDGTAWLAIAPEVLNDPGGLPSPMDLDGEWPPTGLHVWNDTTVEAFFPAGDDPLDPFDIDVIGLIEQITIPVGRDREAASGRAERELEAHGEAYLRPGADSELALDEATFRGHVEAVSAAVDAPHRLEVEGFRARLVERENDG